MKLRKQRCAWCNSKEHETQFCPKADRSTTPAEDEIIARTKKALFGDPVFQEEEMAIHRARKALGTPTKHRRKRRDR